MLREGCVAQPSTRERRSGLLCCHGRTPRGRARRAAGGRALRPHMPASAGDLVMRDRACTGERSSSLRMPYTCQPGGVQSINQPSVQWEPVGPGDTTAGALRTLGTQSDVRLAAARAAR